MIKSGIYQIKNIVNDICYVGSGVSYIRRWDMHKSLLNNNKHYNTYLQQAWNKYGANNFEFRVLELVEDKTKLIEKEQLWINWFNCVRPNGYNLKPTAGNCLGWRPTQETRQKMSLSRKGKKRSPEAKAKMSLAQRGSKKPGLVARLRKFDKWPCNDGCYCKCERCIEVRRQVEKSRIRDWTKKSRVTGQNKSIDPNSIIIVNGAVI